MNNRFAVVVCADSRMAPAACAVLLNAQVKSSESLSLYFVGLALDDVERKNVEEFSRIKSCPIELIDLKLDDLKNHDAGRFGMAALARLYLDELLPKEHDRVLYLDADVYVGSLLDPLFQMPLNGAPIGAVTDISKHGPKHVESRSLELGMSPGRNYVMSGMLLFAWPPDQHSNGLRSARVALEKGKNFKFPDQDAINLGFDGNYKPISPAWNAEPFLWGIVDRVHVFHFSGKTKPWHADAPFQYERFRLAFHEALRDTPWRNWVRRRSVLDWLVAARASVVFAFKVNKKQRNVVEGYGKNAFTERQGEF